MRLASSWVPGTRYIQQHGVVGIGRPGDGRCVVAVYGLVDLLDSGESFRFQPYDMHGAYDQRVAVHLHLRTADSADGTPVLLFNEQGVMAGTNSDIRATLWDAFVHRPAGIEERWDQRFFHQTPLYPNCSTETVAGGQRTVRVRVPAAFAAHRSADACYALGVRRTRQPLTRRYTEAEVSGKVLCTPVYRAPRNHWEDWSPTACVTREDTGFQPVELTAAEPGGLLEELAAAYERPFPCTEEGVRRVRAPRVLAAVAVALAEDGSAEAVQRISGTCAPLLLSGLPALDWRGKPDQGGPAAKVYSLAAGRDREQRSAHRKRAAPEPRTPLDELPTPHS